MLTMESELKDIGVRIKAPRAGRGLTLTALSTELRAKYGVKIDAGYLSKIENGKAEIPLRTLFAIADYFEMSPTKLLGDDGRNDGPRDSGDGAVGVQDVVLKPVTGMQNDAPEMALVLGILNKPSFIRDLRTLKNQVGETRALRYVQATMTHTAAPMEEARVEEAGG